MHRGTYRRHVVRRPNKRLCKAGVVVQNPGQAEVSELHVLLDVEEDVGWFQVPVKDRGPAVAPPVTLLQGQGELRHHPQDELLLQITPAGIQTSDPGSRNPFTHRTGARLPLLDAPVDEAGQVPSFTELHDDVERGIGAVYDAVVVPHNVRVFELPQQVDL